LEARECNSEEQGGGVQITYTRGKEQNKLDIAQVYESGLEVLNEIGSIFFTFSTLYALGSTHRWLFYVSLFCLFMAFFSRLSISLSNYFMVDRGFIEKSDLSTGYVLTRFQTGYDKICYFYAAVLLYLIEPCSGRRAIQWTLKKTQESINLDG